MICICAPKFNSKWLEEFALSDKSSYIGLTIQAAGDVKMGNVLTTTEQHLWVYFNKLDWKVIFYQLNSLSETYNMDYLQTKGCFKTAYNFLLKHIKTTFNSLKWEC